MTTLFDPIQLGAISAANRILMAPLTRARADREAVPTPIMAEYYGQRASAGLIISEATGISRLGLGWPNAPGLWNAAQVEGWKPVTEAVHAKGGKIVAQLWHMGRIGHTSVNGELPVSASAIAAPGEAHTYDGKKPYEVPRALDIAEIPALLDDYARAAENALAAGFDGVQIHAANGYLIDQFLRDGSNKRTDRYGGPIENRLRLLDEVTRAVVGAAGADRTAIRLSPNGAVQGVDDSDQEATFTAAARLLDGYALAFLELRDPRPGSSFRDSDRRPVAPLIRKVYAGPLVVNSDYDAVSGQAALDSGVADAVTFGRTFLANPDLPHRFANGLSLNTIDPKTLYSGGPEGYTDYPVAA
ncbi:alkene reductase [Sphingomonas naphthae]|uniref:Alkene reductase n=1 Tax=Sphingomonas naphthae TaxID=1813468 RepID=A0ABY7TID3_9SPHN|nr:alkene reductase [Sphingomonas naphthae]WCT72982.1 alkene reductase [Sphingomonas naphthae]